MPAFLRSIILLLLTGLGISCNSDRQEQHHLSDYLPEDSGVIFRINDLQGTRTDVKNNGLLSKVEDHSPFALLNDKNSWLASLKTEEEVLLACYTQTDTAMQFSLVTPVHDRLFLPDSIPGIEIDTLRSGNNTIQRVRQSDRETFVGVRDSVFMVSSSQQQIESMLSAELGSAEDYLKASNAKNESELGTYFQNHPLILEDSIELDFASWTYTETQVLPDALLITGIVKAKDSTRRLLNVFEGQRPQPSGISDIVPMEAVSAYGFTYDDLELLQSNLNEYEPFETMTLAWTPFLETINEVGQIELIAGKAIVLKSIDPSLSSEAWSPFLGGNEEYRGTTTYSLAEDAPPLQGLRPLINPGDYSFGFQLDDRFVLAENESVYEEIVSSFTNGATLKKSGDYSSIEQRLSQYVSMVIFNLNGNLKAPITEFMQIPEGRFPDYPIGVLQFTYDRDFAHVSGMLKEDSGGTDVSEGPVERYALELEAPLLSAPQFFNNHRTNGKDVMVQDMNNRLYLISAGGKTLWKRDLKEAILGEIQEVDILKNGKKQLAFATSKGLYVIDRNGNDVAPFPKKFKDEITQPLALFDYDRNRNYRFVIVQGKNVFMYDSKAKIVDGFKYKGTASPIVMPPQHIRIGGKDYLLFAEENGTLNIRSRVGKERIKVSRTFDFTNIPIAKEGQNFVVITRDNTKESISQSGSISPRKLDVSQSYWFTIKGNVKATLDDNLLRINGNLVELPFGVYTQPQIISSNRQTYVLITETQEKRVYLYTKEGKAVNGFPVYGSSLADLGDANRNGKPDLIVQGADNEIILYEIR